MSSYWTALRTSRQLFPGTGDWAAFLLSRLFRQMPAFPMPRRLAKRQFRVGGLDRPIVLRPHTTDFNVAREMFLRREYQGLIDPPPRDVRFVLDLGANVGLSVRLWQHLFPAAHVVAVEPDADNAAVCQENATLGETVAGRATVLTAGIGATAGTAWLDVRRGACSYRVGGEAVEGSLRVEVLSVPDVLTRVGHDGPIDLLKCDIEGGEESLMADCGAWIGRVRALVIETHGRYTVERLTDDLKRGGSNLRLVHRQDRGPNYGLSYFAASDVRA